MVIGGEMTIGQLIAFQILVGQASKHLKRLMGMWQQFQQTALAAERLGDISVPPEQATQSRTVHSGEVLAGNITFKKVDFRCSADFSLVLEQIDLHVKSGMEIGIVGRSGSGTSILTKLVQRLHLPEKGRNIIDKVDIAELHPTTLRRQIGVVLQGIFCLMLV